jgi:hypothetical protein
LVAFEQWPEVTIGVTAGSERVDDIRTAALGDLQGYLYQWIPRFSGERYEPVFE